MNKIIITFLSYILVLFNTNLIADENKDELKVGLLAPFSGDYRSLGESLLLSTQLALDEINDKKIKIIPRDSGSDDREQLNLAIKEIAQEGAKIIIGPMDSSLNSELDRYKNLTFISLSNQKPQISKNVINIGISLESQLKAIGKFIEKEKKK